MGDEFFLWAHNHVASLRRVSLQRASDDSFADFPSDPVLASFDHDDRLWVAAAIVAGPTSVIVNAVDSDYSHNEAELKGNGVNVMELCTHQLKPRSA